MTKDKDLIDAGMAELDKNFERAKAWLDLQPKSITARSLLFECFEGMVDMEIEPSKTGHIITLPLYREQRCVVYQTKYISDLSGSKLENIRTIHDWLLKRNPIMYR